MNLWEGNVGNGLHADLFHGSSSHITVFRNRLIGHQTGYDMSRAVNLDKKQYYYNIVGNVLGDPAIPNWVYEMDTSNSDSSSYVIYRLGFNWPNSSTAGFDPNVKATTLRHGNYDYATGSVVWDGSISDRDLPDSYYLTRKPAWWGPLHWPPIGPDLTPMVGKIPAQVRFESSGGDMGAKPAAPTHLTIQQNQ